MDPKQTLLNCLRFVIEHDETNARELWENYEAWRRKGGCAPVFTADDLMRELSNYF